MTPSEQDATREAARLFEVVNDTPYSVERRGTLAAPWCVVHRDSGLTISVERPYPGQEALPPIEVGNHRTTTEAEAAAQEVDWDDVAVRAATPEWQAIAARAAERRAFDADHRVALTLARAGNGPYPWEREGILHSPVCRVAPTLGRTDPLLCPVCGAARPQRLGEDAPIHTTATEKTNARS